MGLIGLWLFLALFLAILFPFLFAQLMAASLIKLHLHPGDAVAIVIGMFVGGMINIPIRRISRSEDVLEYPYAAYGFGTMRPNLRRTRRETVIAVNVGGCLIPLAVAIYELLQLAPDLWLPTALASLANILVCYWVARPITGVGIAIPGLVPALVAAALAWLFVREQAAPIAFIAGVAGPLIGADLLHLKEITRVSTGMASIGGAGTFDGIFLTGILAVLLAGIASPPRPRVTHPLRGLAAHRSGGPPAEGKMAP